jgi:hypothetical protein
MEVAMKRIISDENGKVLILTLVLLIVGGLIMTPLLGLMTTGLVAGQVYEKKTAELYAADAGIEDALWKIQHDIEIPANGYNLTINDKYVWVTRNSTNTGQFLINLLEIKEQNWVASDWVVIGSSEAGKAEITINWTGSGVGRLSDVGIWLKGTYSYVIGQNISSDDIRAQYPICNFTQKAYSGGTAFIWTWFKGSETNQQDWPAFDKDNLTRTLSFEFTPNNTPQLSIAFTVMGRKNVGLSYDGDVGLDTITATAISDTGTATADIDSQTIVVANVVRSGCAGDEIEVLNWNIS